MQIMVLGMHCSGISLVTRLISMMGAYTGTEGEGVRDASDTPMESRWGTDIRELNDEILASVDADWHRVATLSLKSLDTEQQEAFKERARAIISGLDAYRPWVIADPRLCLVLPLWRSSLEVPVCVFVYRKPSEVAESLRVRNGFPLRFGMALWEKYTVEGLRNSEGLPRIPVAYDDLMTTPVKTVQTLFEQLEASGVRRLECPSAKGIFSVRDETLRHQGESPSRENQYVDAFPSQPFETLRTGAAFRLKRISALSESALEPFEELEAREAQKLVLEEPLLDIRLSLLERRASERIRMIQQLEIWFCQVRDDIRNMTGSWRWRIGDVIGHAAEKVGLIPDPGVLAPARAEGVIAEFEVWQHKAKGRYDTPPSSMDPSAFGVSAGTHDDAAQRIRTKVEIISKRNAWLSETAYELSLLADWLQELWSRVVEMEQSGRWKVGNRLGRIAESFHLIPRAPLTPPDHARQVAALFTQWRQDVFRYASMLDFDDALLALPQTSSPDSRGGGETGNHSAPASVAGPGLEQIRPLTYDVIVFPFVDWKFRIQRPQHLSMQLARHGHRVFFISITFAPVIPSGKFTIVYTPEQGVYVCQLQCPAPFPSVHTDTLLDKQKCAIVEALSELCDSFNARPFVSVVHHPFWLPVVEEMDDGLLVYDCMDLHRGFDLASDDMEREEVRLINAADVVTVSSEPLREFIGRHRDATIIRNAAEVSFFSKKPDHLAYDSGRPVVGYFGAIWGWFDMRLVIAAARFYPDWDFVLVGSTVDCDREEADKVSNVHFFGEVPYESLPGWLHSFDVCMIPFKITELTLHTNPVKLYEYLSAGKPIVATPLPELSMVSEYLHLADSEEAFVQRLSEAMGESRDPALARRRAEWAQQHTWANRALEFQAAIASHCPKVSVVVLTYNGLKFTKACLDSLERFTHYPDWELIVVDNASTDGTPDFLNQYARNHSDVRVLLNSENLGFSGGNNVGLRAARGDCLVILNNDTYVTEGWLLGMVRALQNDPRLGLVGPVTNNIGNEAKIDIDYTTMEEMAHVAHAHTSAHRREKLRVDKVGFFCVGFQRALLEEVGFLDEDFGLGFFEDDDYCLRARKAGYHIAILEDVFIHHHLSGSFNSLGMEKRQAIFEESKAVFEKKWGAWRPHQARKLDTTRAPRLLQKVLGALPAFYRLIARR